MTSTTAVRSFAVLTLCLCLLAGCAGGPGGAAGGGAAAAPPPTSAQAGSQTLVAISPPAQAHMTLPQFLGLDKIAQGMGQAACAIYDHITDSFPQFKLIPSPDELGPNASPASEAAAEVQQDEQQAGEKAAALEYLAKIGCGCYPGVEEAFLAAMDDCTEKVRFAAVKNLRLMAGHRCTNCKSGACCSPKLREKLWQLAFGVNDEGCPIESSGRVRRLARLALQGCGGSSLVQGMDDAVIEVPVEGPSREDIPEPAPAEEVPPPPEMQTAVAGDANVVPTSFAAAAETKQPNVVFARVNGEPIYENEIGQVLDLRLAALGTTLDANAVAGLKSSLQTRIVKELIETRLLADDARRHVPPVEIVQMIDEAARASQRTTGAMTRAETDELLAESWLRRRAMAAMEIPQQDQWQYYEARASEFQTPMMVRWEQVSVRYEHANPNQAAALLEYIRDRTEGRSVAAQPPADAKLANSTLHGWTASTATMSPVMRNAIFSLPVGEISPVLRDNDGLHFVRVLQQRPPQQLPFEAVSDQIRERLVEERLPPFRSTYVAELERSASIWSLTSRTRISDNSATAQSLPTRVR